MHKQLIQLALVLWLGAATAAGAATANKALMLPSDAPLTQASFEAAKAGLARQLSADRAACARLSGHAREVCEAQARGRHKAELARLQARHDPGPEQVEAFRFAVAEANYEVALEKCEPLQRKAKSRCRKDARAAREAAERQARVEKVEATGGIFGDRSARKGAAKSPDS